MNPFDIHVISTSEIDKTREAELMEAFCTTFSVQKPENYFQWKFRDNPFGDSIHVLVYDEGKLISTRAFWRLDIDGTESYQCVDTAVIPSYQGCGIFTLSTEAALKYLGDKPIYNHPNAKSRPAYLKSGWTVNSQHRVRTTLTHLALKSSPEIDWPPEQLAWRFNQNPTAQYACLQRDNVNHIFGFRRNKWAVLLGSTKRSLNLPAIDPKLCLSYDPSAVGIGLAKKQVWLQKGKLPVTLFSYLFDMM